jgi:predicted amidohydrolase
MIREIDLAEAACVAPFCGFAAESVLSLVRLPEAVHRAPRPKVGSLMRIALAQYALGPELTANVAKALEFMTYAQRDAAELLVYPELCISPFFPQFPDQDVARYANELEDQVIQSFQAACRRFKLAASPNVYLRERDRLFDASLLIGSDGRLQGVSKMVHIAQLPGFYEQSYYTPSDTGFRVYQTPLGSIGIVVCFDRHLPESIRTCALRGASLILVPAANTMTEPRDVFECELRAAAFQNGVYIAMCNRVGAEGEVIFCGESTVVDPYGNVVAKGAATEALITADIDLSRVVAARTKRPYLPLRRPDMYA